MAFGSTEFPKIQNGQVRQQPVTFGIMPVGGSQKNVDHLFRPISTPRPPSKLETVKEEEEEEEEKTCESGRQSSSE